MLICFFSFDRFLVRVSYLEIYNEEVKDLLGKDLSARLEVGMAHVIILGTTSEQIFINKGIKG